MNGLVAIVILNYCQQELTLECLRSIAAQEYRNIEVIVTDNGPVDRRISESEVRKLFPDCQFIFNSENRGVSAGCNPGFRKAIQDGAEFIWMLNNDTVVRKDSLSKLMEKINTDSRFGAVSSAIYDMDGKTMQTVGCGQLNLSKVYTLSNLSPDMPFDFLCGTSELIRAAAMESAGLWDENIFMYFEDVEFSLRLKKFNWKLAVAPDSIVYHHGGASFEGKTGVAAAYALVSARYLASKYSEHVFYAHLMILFSRIVRPLLAGRFKDSWLLLRTLLTYRKRIPKRGVNQ